MKRVNIILLTSVMHYDLNHSRIIVLWKTKKTCVVVAPKNRHADSEAISVSMVNMFFYVVLKKFAKKKFSKIIKYMYLRHTFYC